MQKATNKRDGFALGFHLDQKCALEGNLPVATIFCPVVHIMGAAAENKNR